MTRVVVVRLGREASDLWNDLCPPVKWHTWAYFPAVPEYLAGFAEYIHSLYLRSGGRRFSLK